MKLLDSTKTSDKLVELVNKHNRMSFAVAWARENTKVFQAVKQNKSKIRKSVIGTHFSQTDPNVMEWCLECYKKEGDKAPKIGFMFDKTRSVFHPKVYVFWSYNGIWDLLIGSANLTTGGMEKNTELVLQVSSKECSDDRLRRECTKQIEKWWTKSTRVEKLTKDKVKDYRKKYENRPKSHAPSSSNTRSKSDASSSSRIHTSDLLQMNWSEFYKTITTKKYMPCLKERLAFLEKAHQTWRKVDSYVKLSPDDRTALAASAPNVANSEEWKDIRFRWFGSTFGNGKFVHLINKYPVNISRALNHIPRDGHVSVDNYNYYINEIKKGFKRWDYKGHGLATVTRLLAVKRPDYFVSWNERSEMGLKRGLGLKTNLKTRDYERYWDEVVVTINQDAKWYQSKEPKSKLAGEIWKSRVAMLDALLDVLLSNYDN